MDKMTKIKELVLPKRGLKFADLAFNKTNHYIAVEEKIGGSDTYLIQPSKHYPGYWWLGKASCGIC
jgi:hypothetical protein